MSRDSSGTYSLPVGNPVISGTIIASAWANTTMDDLADSMTDSLDREGRGGMLAALRGVNGTVAAPAYSFTQHSQSGWYAEAQKLLAAVDGVKLLEVGPSTLIYGPDVDTLFRVSAAKLGWGPLSDSQLRADVDQSVGLEYGLASEDPVLFKVDNNSIFYKGAPVGTGGADFVGDSPPSGPGEPFDGQGWFQSSTGIRWVYYLDGDSEQWVETGPAPVGEASEGGGSGDVIGPDGVGEVDLVAAYGSTSGKLIKAATFTISKVALGDDGPVTPDNFVAFDGAGGKQLKDSGLNAAALGDVTGPASSSVGNIAVYNNTTGTLLADFGPAVSAVALGSAVSVTAGNFVSFNDTGGKQLSDSGNKAADFAPFTLNALGDIIYRDATGYQKLAIGSAGNLLTVTAGVPAWETPAGGGNVTGTGVSIAGRVAEFNNVDSTAIVPGSAKVAADLVTNAGSGVLGNFPSFGGNGTVIGDSGFDDGSFDLAGAAQGIMDVHEAAPDPHPQYLTPAEGDAAYAPFTLATVGDIIFRDGSGYARLPIGGPLQVLKTNAGGTLPEWGTEAAAGFPGMGIQFNLDVGADKTFTLDQSAGFAYTIDGAVFQNASGTITAAIEIEGTPVTGLTALAISSVEGSGTASALNTVGIGDKVTIVLSSDSTAVDVSFKINGTKT